MRSPGKNFRKSLLRAWVEEHHNDLVLMLANRRRSEQKVISLHARAALPVNKSLCQPLFSNWLSRTEINAFNVRAAGWYIVAVQDFRLLVVDPFPSSVNDADYRSKIEDFINALNDDYGDGPDVYGAFFQEGRLTEFQHLYEFRPVHRRA